MPARAVIFLALLRLAGCSLVQGADCNRNGMPDEVDLKILPGFPTGDVLPASHQRVSLAIADLDADGLPDLVTAQAVPDRLTIRRNLGNRVFSPGQDLSPARGLSSTTALDLDGDGGVDLAVTSEKFLGTFKNRGDGTFSDRTDVELGSRARIAAAADLDGDRDADLALIDQDNVLILLNPGDGLFSKSTTYYAGGDPWSVAAVDLDGTGTSTSRSRCPLRTSSRSW